jgi:hypothetical protein
MTEQLITLETLEVSMLPELQGWKEKQEAIVRENPFIAIVDNKTYEEAKKSRTVLVSARTAIEKQDKLIASKLKDVRTKAGNLSTEVISISLPHEEKQQEEVKRYEAVKETERLEKEKKEKERKEKERKEAIEVSIEGFYSAWKSAIESLIFEGIEAFKASFQENLDKTDVSQFEEFELQFASKVQLLKQQLEDKIQVLTDKEDQRIAAEKLAKEKADFEAEKMAKAKADKAIEDKRIADQKIIDDANAERQQKLDSKEKAIEEKEVSVEKSAFQLKTDIRIKQLTDNGLTFDFRSTYTGLNFFIDILDIKTYDDEKWNDLILKIEEVKSTPIIEEETQVVAKIEVIPVVEEVVEPVELIQVETETTTSEEVQNVFKNLSSRNLFICDYINGRACLKNSNDEIVFSFKLHKGLETLVSLKMALNEFSTLKNQIFN